MTEQDLKDLLTRLLKHSHENEWVELKQNFHSCEEIGVRISALANGACLNNQEYGYLIFGIQDTTNEIVGTSFNAKTHKKGGEFLEHWLAQRLSPRIDFKIHEFDYEDKHISLYRIPAATSQPVAFINVSYIRIGSITRKLMEFPEKERKIWRNDPTRPFEHEIAQSSLSADDVVRLLDTQCFFDLIGIPYPTTREAVLERFLKEQLIKKERGQFAITNLGALLFAKNMTDFDSLTRKVVRVIVYKGKNRIDTIKDVTDNKGFACGFTELVNYINDQLPQNEEIHRALRETVKMYPEIAVREFVANSIIHQDFNEKGSCPVVEVFSDRIEFTNPGLPMIDPIRFIDEYQSRNEILAKFMRRLRICEEKGTGIDKAIEAIELFQLPAPEFFIQVKHTKVTMYAPQSLNAMSRKDKVRACYQHCCLRYISNEKMTNQSLRERFKIEEHNYSIASRIIRDTINETLIKDEDSENKSKKFAKYIPFWG